MYLIKGGDVTYAYVDLVVGRAHIYENADVLFIMCFTTTHVDGIIY